MTVNADIPAAPFVYEISLALDLTNPSGAYMRYKTIAAAGRLENSVYSGQSISIGGGLSFVRLSSSLDYSLSPVARLAFGTVDVASLLTSSIGQGSLSRDDLLQRIRFEGNHTIGCGRINIMSVLSQEPNVTLSNGTSPTCLISSQPAIKFDLLLITVPTAPDYINITVGVPCTAIYQVFLDFNEVTPNYVHRLNM